MQCDIHRFFLMSNTHFVFFIRDVVGSEKDPRVLLPCTMHFLKLNAHAFSTNVRLLFPNVHLLFQLTRFIYFWHTPSVPIEFKRLLQNLYYPALKGLNPRNPRRSLGGSAKRKRGLEEAEGERRMCASCSHSASSRLLVRGRPIPQASPGVSHKTPLRG